MQRAALTELIGERGRESYSGPVGTLTTVVYQGLLVVAYVVTRGGM